MRFPFIICMRDTVMAPCNYRLCYNDQWKRGYRFLEKGDRAFPFAGECPAPVFMGVGESVRSHIVLAGGPFPEKEMMRTISDFASEASLNGFALTVRSVFGSERAVIEGVLRTDGRVRVVLTSGLDVFMRSYGNLLSRILISGGEVLSPFEPGVRPTPESKAFTDSLVAFTGDMIAFGMSKRERNCAVETLDRGGDVFLHRSALSSVYGRRLAAEGAPVIDSFTAYMTQKDIAPEGYLFRDAEGRLSFLKL